MAVSQYKGRQEGLLITIGYVKCCQPNKRLKPPPKAPLRSAFGGGLALAFPASVGLAFRAIRVEDQLVRTAALANAFNPLPRRVAHLRVDVGRTPACSSNPGGTSRPLKLVPEKLVGYLVVEHHLATFHPCAQFLGATVGGALF